MKHEQSVMDWQNIYYKLEEPDKTVERIQELAEKMSKVSGYEVEGYITGFTKPFTEVGWNFLICHGHVQLSDISMGKNSQVTEKQLDGRIKEMSEESDTDMENCKTSIEEAVECCEGGNITAGCHHDNCTGSVVPDSTPCLEDVTTWKCFKQVASVLGEEHAEYELKKVLQGYREGDVKITGEGDLDKTPLVGAFSWFTTSRGWNFWDDIDEGILPEGYHTTADVPSYTPKGNVTENKLEECLDDVTEDNKHPTMSLELRSQSVGELVEELYFKLLPSDVTISINGNGQILLHSNTTPVVDVSKLSAEDIDKAYEAMVMLEGCFVEYNEKEGE